MAVNLNARVVAHVKECMTSWMPKGGGAEEVHQRVHDLTREVTDRFHEDFYAMITADAFARRAVSEENASPVEWPPKSCASCRRGLDANLDRIYVARKAAHCPVKVMCWFCTRAIPSKMLIAF
eukprot:jgi/Mesvir1/6380/Mv12115-RA.1